MRLRIDHTTVYNYEKAAVYALHQVRKRPHDTDAQTVMAWELVLDGAKLEAQYVDHHGNHVDLVSIEPDAKRVSISCQGEVETRDTAGVLTNNRMVPPLWLYRRFTPLTKVGKGVRGLVSQLGKDPALNLETLHELMNMIAEAVVYDTQPTGPNTTAEEALEIGHGVCQDHAYMMMLDRVDQDAGHAWAEAWVEGLGWVGFDAANRVCPDERYIQVATGLDYREAGPMTGVMYGGEREVLSVNVQVQQ